MSADRSDTISTRQLLCLLEGEVTVAEAGELREVLERSPAARAARDRLGAMLDALRAPGGEIEEEDLVAGVRVGAVPDAAPRASARRWGTWAVAAVLGCAAVTGVGLWLRASTVGPGAEPESGEYRPKSAGAPAEEPWVALEVYYLPAGGSPARVGSRLPRGDGLLCAYSNLGRTPFTHLMIIAVDRRGEVFWLYPPFERPGTDPSAVAIGGGARQQLPDLVHHDFLPGPLAFYGLFTRRPLRVNEVEAAVRRATREPSWNLAAPPRLPLAGTAQAIVPTEVGP
jgi:hypothetical protein